MQLTSDEDVTTEMQDALNTFDATVSTTYSSITIGNVSPPTRVDTDTYAALFDRVWGVTEHAPSRIISTTIFIDLPEYTAADVPTHVDEREPDDMLPRTLDVNTDDVADSPVLQAIDACDHRVVTLTCYVKNPDFGMPRQPEDCPVQAILLVISTDAPGHPDYETAL